MKEILLRFVAGGTVVSVFALFGRRPETEKFRWTIRSSTFRGYCNIGVDRLQTGQGIRKRGSQVDALWRRGLLFLRLARQSPADSRATTGFVRHRSVDDVVVRLRFRLLVCRAEVTR